MLRHRKCLGIAVAFILAFLGLGRSVFSQSVIYLPRIVEQEGRYTGIAIANASNRTASFSIQLYDDGGNPVSSLNTSKAAVKLLPGGQLAELDTQLLQAPSNFRGWAQIVSNDNSNLRGFYLIGDAAGTYLDGANSPQPLREQILPFLANDATTDTEINIVNPTDQVAYGQIQTIAFDGTPSSFGGTGFTLQSHATLRLNSKALGFGSYSGGSYMSISSNAGLLAMELVENQAQPMLACVNGVDVNAADNVINFPHAVIGADYFSLLGIVNLLDIPQTVTVSFYDSDGVLVNTGAVPNPVTVNLDPKASLRTSLSSLFKLNTSGGPLISGWVRVESNFGPITGFIAFGNDNSSDVAAALPQVRPANQLIFSHVAAQSSGYFTGIALLNTNSSAANVKMSVIDQSGVTTAVKSFQIEPDQKIAQVLADLLPEVKDQQGGSVVVDSDQPLYGMELLGSTNLQVLANVPVEEGLSAYTPADVGKFVLSGKISSDSGSLLSGAAVQLSGSITGMSVTSDDQGQYVFMNVPSGNYAIEPSLRNFGFAPAALSVSINSTSVGDADFQGKRLPSLAITSISPPNGPVGSPVTIFGNGFSTNPDENVVHFPGTFFAATVLKIPAPTDSQMTVLVPASALTGPVVVRIGDSVSNSVQFSVTESKATTVDLPASTPSSVAISGLGNLALVGHSDSGTISLVSLAPNPAFVQDVSFGSASKSGILAVATDDDGRGGGTTRDHGIGFFSIEQAAFNALQSKVARFGAKVDRPSQAVAGALPITTSNVQFVQLPDGSDPVSLAFEPFGQFAMTANNGTDSVSFIEFVNQSTPVVRGTLNLPAGSKPVSVSVAANGRRALVANSGTDSVSVIEFAQTAQGYLTGGLQPVVTRNFLLASSPTAVSINLDASVGITANADNTASILNLNGPADASAIITIALPKFSPGTPSAVSASMAPNGTYAIVTSRDGDGNAYLNIISLEGTPEVSFVQVLPKGSGTSAVAIGPNSSSYLVANPLLSNVAVFNPTPGSISLDTLSLSRAQVKQSVTLFGTGFSANPQNNVVRFRGQNQASIPAPTLSTSSNEITVEVPVGATSGPVTVSVGQVSSNEQFFVVLPNATASSVPVISAIKPNTVSPRGNNVLTIQGSGFTAQSTVEIDLGNANGLQPLEAVFSQATVLFINSTQLQLTIPGTDLANVSASFNLDVLNPPPNGGRSNQVTVLVVGTVSHGTINTPQ